MRKNFLLLYISHKNLIIVTLILTMSLISFIKPQNFVFLYDNERYIVNFNRKTIKNNFNTYEYHIYKNNNNDIKYVFTYPNGAEYTLIQRKNETIVNSTNNYNEDKYKSGKTLFNLLNMGEPQKSINFLKIFPVIVLIFEGIIDILYPYEIWKAHRDSLLKHADQVDSKIDGKKSISSILEYIIFDWVDWRYVMKLRRYSEPSVLTLVNIRIFGTLIIFFAFLYMFS